MYNLILIFALFVGILAIKAIWIITDVFLQDKKIHKSMITSNTLEISYKVLHVISGIYFPLPYGSFQPFFTFIGVTMYVVGMILVLWARTSMRTNWGHPGKHDTQRQKHVVTSGPFAFTRHPIYVGFAFIFLGFPLAIGSWFIFLEVPGILYFYRSAVKEEAFLVKYFGKAYTDYMKRVPRIPFIG